MCKDGLIRKEERSTMVCDMRRRHTQPKLDVHFNTAATQCGGLAVCVQVVGLFPSYTHGCSTSAAGIGWGGSRALPRHIRGLSKPTLLGGSHTSC
ncbi:hypothetical protein E2C01_059264 [Portunus trituberculatus]|uniref:Uncharacterized protein n=1 Tax=Portunus trituberculatus TaxID=210409 RepID=A0A5B7H6B7_PORTR|nr:hypothetical protein [Portunus trituberculatus]